MVCEYYNFRNIVTTKQSAMKPDKLATMCEDRFQILWIQCRSQGWGQNSEDTTNFVKLSSPYLIGEFFSIKHCEEKFTILLITKAFRPLTGYATIWIQSLNPSTEKRWRWSPIFLSFFPPPPFMNLSMWTPERYKNTCAFTWKQNNKQINT